MRIRSGYKILIAVALLAVSLISSIGAASASQVKYASDSEYPFELNWENSKVEKARREPAQSENDLPIEERVKKRMYAGGSDDQSLDVLPVIPKYRFENEVISENFD